MARLGPGAKARGNAAVDGSALAPVARAATSGANHTSRHHHDRARSAARASSPLRQGRKRGDRLVDSGLLCDQVAGERGFFRGEGGSLGGQLFPSALHCFIVSLQRLDVAFEGVHERSIDCPVTG